MERSSSTSTVLNNRILVIDNTLQHNAIVGSDYRNVDTSSRSESEYTLSSCGLSDYELLLLANQVHQSY